MDFASLRKEYTGTPLHRKDLAINPLEEFQKWLTAAEAANIREPNATILSTVDPQGQPTSRTVLLKDFNESGFIFYTNTQSDKAKDIAQNPKVSLLFLWIPLERQVRINGIAKPLIPQESEKYFQSRPLGSQLAAWASPQSQAISSRQALDQLLVNAKQRFNDQSPLPLPPHWGGYSIKPTQFEFWQGAKDRLHDRFRYILEKDRWMIERLAP